MLVKLQTTAQLLAEGLDSDQLRRLVSLGEVTRVRRGVYDRDPADLAPVEAHRRLIAATMPQLDANAALSHVSAAVLHGMAVPTRSLGRVWVTRVSAGGGHLRSRLHEHKAPFRAADVVLLDGWPVTTAPRTAIDLARRVGPDYGLAAADQVLRSGGSRESLAEQVALWPRRPGMGRARALVAIADGGAESYGESVSRLLMWQLGLPMPVLQFEVHVHAHLYRSDFGWPELGVLGEFDGRVKYADLLRPGQSAADVLMAEKRREQQLQAMGWHVVRWGMDELRNPEGFRRLLLAAFRNAARPPASA